MYVFINTLQSLQYFECPSSLTNQIPEFASQGEKVPDLSICMEHCKSYVLCLLLLFNNQWQAGKVRMLSNAVLSHMCCNAAESGYLAELRHSANMHLLRCHSFYTVHVCIIKELFVADLESCKGTQPKLYFPQRNPTAIASSLQ